MGDNSAYTHMEASVIAAYNGGLRGEQLAPLLEPYRGSDIDPGGRCDLLTNDGKDIDEVLMEAFGTPEQLALYKRYVAEGDAGLEDQFFDALYEITHGRFGWC
jgi:hypothetical protein